MTQGGALSERALILAPLGRDGEIAALILEEAGYPADVHKSLPALCADLENGAGLAILAEEAIHNADLRRLVAFFLKQPPWSDFPIILMTHRGGGPERNPAAVRLGEILGNVSFLERPFHPTTLANAVRTAVRSRRRQYQARSHLEALTEGEQRLQTALRAGRLGSWSLVVAEKYLIASEATKMHFGRDPEAPFSYDDLIASAHPDDRTRVEKSLADFMRTGEDYRIEYRNVWTDGSLHWVDVRARALKDKTGAIEHLVGVSSDITARKTAEIERERLLADLAAERSALGDLTYTLEQRVEERTAELMRAQEQLLQSQKMEAIGQLTGGVAHDFNNLLMAVMANLEILRKRSLDDSRALHLIDGAMMGAQRGAALTQRMLAFARQQDLQTHSADMSSLLLGMRELLERSLTPQIGLTYRIAHDLPPAQVDANQIELAILNLVINARDAMPLGGRIEIIVTQSPGDPNKNLLKPSYLKIEVSDNGSGMNETTLKKAIEPFFSTKPLGKGAGLGLSMVHGLAVQLGGLLELSSELGKGTKASLWVPTTTKSLRNDEPQPAQPVPPVEDNRIATILLVDDDPLIAMSTVDMLEDLGHKVIETHSPFAALEILEGGQLVDLIVTDHAMPGMTGVELAKIVQSKAPAMPILLATGYADLPAGQKINLPRLTKPYRQEQLQAEINRLLRKTG